MKFETVLLVAGLVLPSSGTHAEPVTLIRDAKTLLATPPFLLTSCDGP